ncbi:hypothetical protein AYK25_09960 [Thermoplasmatales archaeon SM1-50]|nr:MAG: hypothetical protein AYK25_09960 [Thermoplasmatales archaeon SM1-50]
MKEIRKKKNLIMLVCASVLICCSYSAVANTPSNTALQTIQISKSLSLEPKGNVSILSENFSAGSMPPSGWVRSVTNPNGTWKIDTARRHSVPNSASVYRGLSCFGLQDEWLITPNLNFSEYSTGSNKYFLRFWWYTDIYVVQNSVIHFNVSISTNGGINWTKIWTAKDQSGFPQYKWTEIGMPIDISEYRDESNVTIGFQFFSNTTQHAIAQFFAIDDILVITNVPGNFTCDAGGPYSWYYYRQFDYIPNGARLHGNVTEGYNPYLCQWLWDFGNNKTSLVPVDTWNFYEIPDMVYNVTLQVTYGDRVAFDNTTIWVFLAPPPNITIELNLISFPGINAKINNPGGYNATYVNWSIDVFLGPLKLRERIVANGTIENVESGSIASIASKYFFGCKLIHIHIVATPENIPGWEESFYALKFGPFTIALQNFMPEKI